MIYLIKCSKTKSCKIGFTNKEPLKRLGALQTGNPYELELITTINGEQDLEKELHLKFNHLKLKGEWFQYNQEIKDYFKVDDYTQVYDNMIFLSKNLTATEIRLCLLFTKLSSEQNVFNTNDLFFKKCKKELSLEFSKVTFYSAINKLEKEKILVKLQKGQYQVNPLLLWRASQVSKKELLENIIADRQLDNFNIELVSETNFDVPQIVNSIDIDNELNKYN